MASGLVEILQLQPVRFDYKQLKSDESPWDSLARLNRVGFIAQDVAPIIPEAVNYNPFDDFFSLSPSALIPYLVASIQELNATVLALTERLETLEADNAAMVTPTFSSVQPNGNPAETVAAAGNKLWSNVPNPFKQETRIRYALTEDVREAQLCIYDLSGRQLSCHRLNDRGESEFVLRAASLNPGIYLYSLIADGQVVDTHRMVVTE
ncbi:MAG: tail fiber domain-containing protein [Bacteroidales bacterium]|nr:tail fiber domain-containing protein [Bacteroidales bacterium]